MKSILKIYHLLTFPLFYLVKLVSANLFIAYDILTPRMHVNPGTIEVEIIMKSDFGLLLCSNLVSMTPGTLSLELDKEKGTLLVHTLYINKQKSTEREIARIMKRIQQITE